MLGLSNCETTEIQTNTIVQLQDFKVDKQHILGIGSFAKAYMGWDKNNTKVCVKAVQKSQRKKHILKMAKQQAFILANLSHPNINKFITSFESQHHFYIITQYYDGQNLREYIKNNKNQAAKQAYEIAKELLSILEYLHSKKIMHRDLKPENIIKTKQKLILIDFGFSCNLGRGDASILKQIVGTPTHMAPELLQNKKYTSKADIWSFGVIIYQLTNGKLPWIGKTEQQLLQKINTQKLQFQNSKIMPILKILINECLQICPDNRISWKKLFELFNRQKSKPFFELKLEQQESLFCSCSFFG